jgi:hypothetical protein
MRPEGTRDFASMLDELIAELPLEVEESAARPNIPFDYVSVAEELHSGRIRVSTDAVAAEYRDVEAATESLFAAAEAARAAEALPSIEPAEIARELGLDSRVVPFEELGRKRRAFAFDNHPDRVEPHLRDRAMVRMQVANTLIDDAERLIKRAAR